MRKEKETYYKTLTSNSNKDPKGIWSTLKKLLPKPSKTPNNIEIDEKITTFPSKIANHFNSYFATIGSKLGESLQTNLQSVWTSATCSSSKFQPIQIPSVLNELKSLRVNKGAGLDNIPPRLLKAAADIIAPSLTYIFNLSLSKGVFPQDFKVAKVTPLFKSGSRDQVGNYRPISVLPIATKVFEKEVHKQLYKYLTDNNLLHPSQHGFRRKRSTQTALIKVVDNWLTNIDKGQVTAVVFLDLAKAFDIVKHNILVRKLETLGVTGPDLDWFSSYLDNRQQQVFYNGVFSSTEHILSGVPQGSCLGPLRFLVYINDLPCCISHSTVNFFADDTALYYSSNNADEILRRLNVDLENISKWIKLNGLALNPKKCEFMVVGSPQTQTFYACQHFNVKWDSHKES